MATLTQAQFGIFVGASRPSVCVAIKEGRLAVVDGGIDTDHPASLLFAEAQHSRRTKQGLPASPWSTGYTPTSGRGSPGDKPLTKQLRQPAAKRPSPPRARTSVKPQKAPKPAQPAPAPVVPTPPAAPPVSRKPATGAGMDRLSAKDEEIAVKNKILRTKLQRERAAVWKDARLTVSAAAARAVIGKISAAIEENFRTFAERHADQLAAMAAVAADRAQFAEYLDAEIGKAMTTVVKQCRVSAEFVAEEVDDGLE